MVRVLAGVLLALALTACGEIKVPLEYKPMTGPTAVTGRPVVALKVSGNPSPVAGKLGGYYRHYIGSTLKFGTYVAGRDILELTRSSVVSEFGNRGITVGDSPVLVTVHVADFSADVRLRVNRTIPDGAAQAILDFKVFVGDEKKFRFFRSYKGTEDNGTMIFVFPVAVGGLASDAFAKAMHAAMSDDALFGAIRAALKDAGS